MDNKELMVTIQCLAYNHEAYIRQCLEGFVMQKTNFRFEAIVHDDASTDGTAAIIREYAEKYPDIIKPIFETENQYSKRDGSIRRIMNEHTYGKYIAMCEGDDYWIDPLKLQKQVDFLEGNPEYTMCFANAMEHYEDNPSIEDKVFSNIEKREYRIEEIFKKWIIPTATVLYNRKIVDSAIYKNKISDNKNLIYGDLPLFLCCATYGKIYGFKDIVSVYNRHIGGVTRIKKTSSILEKKALHVLEMREIFSPNLNGHAESYVCYYYCLSFFKSIIERNVNIKYRLLIKSFKLSAKNTFYSLGNILFKIK